MWHFKWANYVDFCLQLRLIALKAWTQIKMLEIKMKAFELSSRSSNPDNLSKAHNPFPITRLLGVSTLNSSAFYHNLWWEACWNFKIKFTEEGNRFTPSCNTRQTGCVQLKRLMLWKSRFLHRLWLFVKQTEVWDLEGSGVRALCYITHRIVYWVGFTRIPCSHLLIAQK